MKKVLVTGGTRGIGREIAREFLRRGFFVCAAYSSDEQSAAESAAEGIDVFRADVSDEAQVRALFGHVGTWIFSSTMRAFPCSNKYRMYLSGSGAVCLR